MKLFEPTRIGTMELKNRLVGAAMNSRLAETGGYVSQRIVNHYARRAQGGAGLIVVADGGVSLVYVYSTYLLTGPGGEIDLISLLWFGLMLVLPFIYLIFRLISARDRRDYHFCSNLTKIIMLSGILYSAVFYFIIQPFII